MTVGEEHNFAKMIADVKATSGGLRETIQVRELAARHRLGQMRPSLMLDEHHTWKREFDFDRIETAAEMDEKHSAVSDPFFYSNMLYPMRPHTPDEFTLEIKVDVERLRIEIILSQTVPTQCGDSLPRRTAVDMGSEESGTPRRSPAIGTGSDEPGVSRVETLATEEVIPLETSMDGFLHSNCTSLEYECILFHQPDAGVDDEKETTATTQQAAVLEEFARPTKKQQQQNTTVWTTDRTSSSTGAGL